MTIHSKFKKPSYVKETDPKGTHFPNVSSPAAGYQSAWKAEYVTVCLLNLESERQEASLEGYFVQVTLRTGDGFCPETKYLLFLSAK